ncbi:unnamed protein product, partial [Phaeothamnion confervicola]
MQREEARNLTFDAATSIWTLHIEYPMPGFAYQLRWPVPNPTAHQSIRESTTENQKLLLELRDRAVAGALAESDKQALQELDAFVARLIKAIGKPARRECHQAYWLAYDAEQCQLRCLHAYPPQDLSDPRFDTPLGRGVGGAAFLRRQHEGWR